MTADGNCVPIENIRPFSYCKSPHLEETLRALLPSAKGEEKTRYEQALTTIDAINQGQYFLPPCALPLLDRWFDEDEKV